MEIRNVVNEVKKDYPKMKQVSKKKLENSIPNKWLKVGLSSLAIAIVMNSKIFATSSFITPNDFTQSDFINMPGLVPTEPIPIRICNITQIVSIVTFIILGISILITKIKSKKQSETRKVKKWINVLFIISIYLFALSSLVIFFIDNMSI